MKASAILCSADYVTWTDQELKENAYLDRDEDGSIDLKTEVSWGHSRNAAKRDVGANTPTDLTQDAWDAPRGRSCTFAEDSRNRTYDGRNGGMMRISGSSFVGLGDGYRRYGCSLHQ